MECEHTCEASEATSFSAQTRQKGFYEMEDIGNGFQKKMKHNEQSGRVLRKMFVLEEFSFYTKYLTCFRRWAPGCFRIIGNSLSRKTFIY